MRNIFTALIIGIALAGVSLAQSPSKITGTAPRLAVVEFTPSAQASPAMTFEAKRHFQASIANSLNNTRKFNVYDVRNTRDASQANLASINGKGSTAAAIKLGKQLEVAYVVTGTVNEYTPKGTDGYGSAAVSVRLIEVKTGKVKYSGDLSVRSGKPMRSGGQAEMQTNVLRHIVDQMTELLTGSH